MKSLFTLVIISASMMAFTVAPAEFSDVPATKTCDDGTVVKQDEECPETITFRHEGEDGSIYRRTCPLQDEGTGLIGWNITIVRFFPYIIITPEFGTFCDYGPCGTYPLEDLVEGGGPA